MLHCCFTELSLSLSSHLFWDGKIPAHPFSHDSSLESATMQSQPEETSHTAISKQAASPVAAMYSAFSASSCRALLMQDATWDASLALPPALFSSSCIRLHTAHHYQAPAPCCGSPVYKPILLLRLQLLPDMLIFGL